MKYLKFFENIDDKETKIGCYVLIKLHNVPANDKINKQYVENNVWKITKKVEYGYKIDCDITDLWITNTEIAYISKNKEDLLIKLQAKKYNI